MHKSVNKFQKQQRLLRSAEFRSIFQFNCKLKTPYFAMYVKPNSFPHGRLGLVVPKKAVRLAVQRNYFKRLLREAFRLNQGVVVSLDVLILVYQNINRLDTVKLRSVVDKQWVKLTTLCAKS